MLDILSAFQIVSTESGEAHRGGEGGSLVGGILGTLSQALKQLEGSGHVGDRRNIRWAMALVGGLDKKTAQTILSKEGA
jgi:hypothetical protein